MKHIAETAAILEVIAHELAVCDANITKFRNDFAENPMGALQWSASVFEAVALRSVLGQVAKLLDAHPLDQVRRKVHASLTSHAKRGSSSCMATSNLMRDEIISAWARASELLVWV